MERSEKEWVGGERSKKKWVKMERSENEWDGVEWVDLTKKRIRPNKFWSPHAKIKNKIFTNCQKIINLQFLS